LERVCNYVTRPALALERLTLNMSGEVVYELKHPLSNGTTHFVLEPVEFLAKLAALVPRPRVNFAPKQRKQLYCLAVMPHLQSYRNYFLRKFFHSWPAADYHNKLQAILLFETH